MEKNIEYCDKCSGEVTTSNCAVTMHSIAWDEPMAWTALFSRRRCITCSPSRAQHIVHPDFEPVVDDREAFDKRLFDKDKAFKFEKRWTSAWLMCQHEEVAMAYIDKLCALSVEK